MSSSTMASTTISATPSASTCFATPSRKRSIRVEPTGRSTTFDDLPAEYRKNIDVIDAPLDRKLGDKPALDDAEIDDIVAFLGTLTDGYKP